MLALRYAHHLSLLPVFTRTLTRTMATTARTLPPTLRLGVLGMPGTTPESQRAAEQLLEEDRLKHHCIYGRANLHNHLSHQ
jgi:hypothetical protein